MVQGKEIDLSKGEILNEIVRVSNLEDVPDDPRVCDMNKYGSVSSGAVISRFDSWTKAKELAGIDEIRQHSSTRRELTCAECGVTEMRPESDYVNKDGDWLCSSECSKSYYWTKKDCDNCGITFERRKSQIERCDSTYCSMECKREGEATSSEHRVKLNRWADNIKKSADYICEDCGESYKVMCAHHVPPRSELSSKEEELNLDNGVCLCYPCHANRHRGTPKENVIISWWNWYRSEK
jgi:hypothetical protein